MQVPRPLSPHTHLEPSSPSFFPAAPSCFFAAWVGPAHCTVCLSTYAVPIIVSDWYQHHYRCNKCRAYLKPRLCAGFREIRDRGRCYVVVCYTILLHYGIYLMCFVLQYKHPGKGETFYHWGSSRLPEPEAVILSDINLSFYSSASLSGYASDLDSPLQDNSALWGMPADTHLYTKPNKKCFQGICKHDCLPLGGCSVHSLPPGSGPPGGPASAELPRKQNTCSE